MNFEKIFNNRNIVITGHTGFKGSWLTLWLTELGANVVGYSLEPPELAKKVIDYWGSGGYEIEKSSENFHEANLLKLNCS